MLLQQKPLKYNNKMFKPNDNVNISTTIVLDMFHLLGSNVNLILVVNVRTTKIASHGNIDSEYHGLFRVNKA